MPFSTMALPLCEPQYQSAADVVVLGQGLGEDIALPGDDVHGAARHVAGVEHLVEIGRCERLRRRRAR